MEFVIFPLVQVVHVAILLVEILSFENRIEKYNTDFALPSLRAIIPLISALRLLYDVHMSIYTTHRISRSSSKGDKNPTSLSLPEALLPFSALKKRWYLNTKQDILFPEYIPTIANVAQLSQFVESISSTAPVLPPLMAMNKINIPHLPFGSGERAIPGHNFPAFTIPSMGSFSKNTTSLLTFTQENLKDMRQETDQEVSLSWPKTIYSSSWRHGRHYPLIPGLYKRGDSETYSADAIFQSGDFDTVLQATSSAIGFSPSDVMYHLSIFDRTHLCSISKSNIFRKLLL